MSVFSISTKKKRTVSTSSIRKPQVIHLDDPFLEQVLAEDDEYLYVLSIREEIIENALDLCHESYLKIQSVKYLVDCLHKAFVDVLNISLMYYNPLIVSQNEIWTPEPQMEPLASDNYSEFSVPFITTKKDEVRKLRMASIVTHGDYEPEYKFSEVEPSEQSKSSEGTKQITTFAKLPGEEYEEAVGGKLTLDKGLEEMSTKYEDISLYETGGNVGEYEGRRGSFDSSTSELFEQLHSESSFFTGVVEAKQNFLPYIEPLRCENSLPKLTEYSKDKSHKGTILEISKSVTGILPPLRLKAKFKYTDNSRSMVKFGKSATSFDRPAGFIIDAKDEIKKEIEVKEKASDEIGKEKEEKKVDIDDKVQKL